ncbi:MAG: cobalamin-binding protein [Desulfobacteraceae bacterium]|nr:MAG: cobalamin-binding protein [Desulfobacteraceae bacterium]
MTNAELLKQAVIEGNRKDAVALVEKAVREGVDPERLFNEYLIPAMNVVGDKFQRKEIFVPEMMIAARSMQACMDLLKPLIRKEAEISLGTVVIGTVFGDLHDIGKNLVKLLLESSGFTVVDLGENVPAVKFVEGAKAHSASIVGLSSLLTTGDPHVEETVRTIKHSELGGKVKVVCGGAGVTKKFIEERCGADAYAENAAEGVKKIRELLGLK